MAKVIVHVHTKDFRGGPELKKEIRQALSTANRLAASALPGEAASIKKVIQHLEKAEQAVD